MGSLSAKLVLGTVQFGLEYGISNEGGQVSPGEVEEILKVAAEGGITKLDTARAYGNAEEVIGNSITNLGFQFDIVSKLKPGGTSDDVTPDIEKSMEYLKTDFIYGYLVHNYFRWLYDQGITAYLRMHQDNKEIGKYGFSFNAVEELEKVIELKGLFSMVQVPYNLFDRRFETCFESLKEIGVEIHTRSAFLQGLFFMDPNNLAPHFQPVKNKIRALQQFAEDNGLTLPELILNFPLLNDQIDHVVIGVTSAKQLRQNLKALEAHEKVRELLPRMNQFIVRNESILNPSKWK